MSVQTETKKSGFMKGRVRKTRTKAEFVGILYLIGSLLLAVAAFFPMVYGTPVGNMSVVTFWKPYLALKGMNGSVRPVLFNVGISTLYLLLLLIVVIKVLSSLGKLGGLYKKRPSVFNGFNRNAMAMEELGKAFSVVFSAVIVFPFMIYLFADGAAFTPLFYVAVLVGLIIHFWGGLVGGNVSLFTIGENVTEEKRRFGRIAPFFRNLMQLFFVGLIMYWISETNIMLNLLKWLEKGAFSAFFKGPKSDLIVYGILPAMQGAICIWTLVLLKHATGIAEFDREGKDAPGMKVFRVFSILTWVTAGLAVGLMFWLHARQAKYSPSMGMLYIAVIGFAAMIEELCMSRLPNVKGNAVSEDDEEDEDPDVDIDPDEPVDQSIFNKEEKQAAAAAFAPPAGYQIPLQCISQPGVFLQPNGQPIMIMPMIAGAQYPVQPVSSAEQSAPQQAYAPYYGQTPYGYTYVNQDPYANPYGYGQPYWVNGRPYRYDPYHYEPEPETTEEKPEPEKKKSTEERKSDLAAEKKALRKEVAIARKEGAIARKEGKFADERDAVEKELAKKSASKASAVTEEPVSEPLPALPAPAKEAAMETYAYEVPKQNFRYYPEATDLSEEDLSKPLPPKKWQVTCPECSTKLTVKEGAFAYRCPECGGVFQLRKVYRAKQGNNN